MIVSIIGSGNTATVLGKLLKEKKYSINEILGTNKDAVKQLAGELNANAVYNFSELSQHSDVFIIAVKDDVVADVAAQLNLNEKIVVHTAGSVSVKVLEKASKNYGVLYPLQSLRKEINNLPEIPFLIDANNDETKKIVQQLAFSISSFVSVADDTTRVQYHLSAVIVSNFSNHLFTLAKDYCDKNKIGFNQLLPLIEETVKRLHQFEPSEMQTGPAIRNDVETMQAHLRLLKDFPLLNKIYEMMSESIIAFKK
ncbi:MAG: DUF2520 domain-containing protein [Parafilimonas sp.]|nr:DUF2520 domain-containing protein [Parafilimonas sp.]